MKRVLDNGISLVPILGHKVHLYGISGDILVFSIENQESGNFRNKDHVFFNGNEVLAYNGIPYYDGQNTASWSESLYRKIIADGLENSFTSINGTYSAAYTSRGGVYAYGDFSGLSPLFYYDDDEVSAVSNRQFLLALCQNKNQFEYNFHALSWLPGQANIIGEESVFSGVKILAPGSYVEISDALRVRSFNSQIWNGNQRELGECDFDEIAHHLLRQCEQIRRLPINNLKMSLTGGKDSRLNLALAIRSGMIDKVDSVFTTGKEESPEIEIAQHICSRMNLQHKAFISNPAQFDIGRTWEKLRYHAFRFEGSVCPWDGFSDPSKRSNIEINGMGGEIFSKHVKSHACLDIADINQAKKLFENYQQQTDPLGVMHGYYKDYQKKYMHDLVEGMHQSGVGLNSIGDMVYINNRLTMWSGLIADNTFAKARLFPLVNFQSSRIAFSGNYSFRQMARFHFEIMKRTVPELAELPFLGSKWDERLAPYLGGIKPAEMFRPTSQVNSQNLTHWQWEFMEFGWGQIKEFLLGSKHSGLFEIVDYDRLESVFRHPDRIKKTIDVKEILSLIEMQYLLTNQFRSAYEGSPEHVELVTNIRGLVLQNNKLADR